MPTLPQLRLLNSPRYFSQRQAMLSARIRTFCKPRWLNPSQLQWTVKAFTVKSHLTTSIHKAFLFPLQQKTMMLSIVNRLSKYKNKCPSSVKLSPFTKTNWRRTTRSFYWGKRLLLLWLIIYSLRTQTLSRNSITRSLSSSKTKYSQDWRWKDQSVSQICRKTNINSTPRIHYLSQQAPQLSQT